MFDGKGISQREKREVLRNDQRVREGSTFFAHAAASAQDDMGGRFAMSGQSVSVTGSNPGAWPKMPEGNFWAKNELPPEPLIDGTGEGNVLGYRIDDMTTGSTTAAVEDRPTPSPSDDSHVITKQGGVGRVPPKFIRRL
jgi:hypothetical protein